MTLYDKKELPCMPKGFGYISAPVINLMNRDTIYDIMRGKGRSNKVKVG